jgi:PAS domain S-box-containing protein
VGTVTDVQETLESQQRLQEVEARSARQIVELEEVYDQAPIGPCVLSADLRYIRINRRLAEINGLSPEAHIGRTVWEVLPAVADQLERLARQVLESGHPIFASEIVGETPTQPNLRRTWINTWFPHKDSSGRIISINCVVEEITERVEAERAFRNKAAEFEAVLNAVPGAIFIALDPVCRKMTGNEECRDLLRSPPGSIASKSAPPGEAPTNFRVVKNGVELAPHELPIQIAAATGRQIRNVELQLVFEDGLIKHIYGNATPLFTPAGETRGAVGAFVDATGLVEAREAACKSEATLRLAIEAAELGTWDLDLATGELFWSDRCKAMFGISPLAPANMNDFYNGLHPGDRARITEIFAAAIDPTRRQAYDVEYRTIGKEDGVERWVAAKGRAFFDESGNGIRAIGTVIDITRRKHVEQQLSQTLELLRGIGDCTADAFYAKDLESRIIFANPAALANIGKPIAEVIGRSALEWHPNRDQAQQIIANDRDVIDTGAAQVREEVFEAPDGVTKIYRSSKAPLRDSFGAIIGVVGVSSDINELKSTETQLRRMAASYKSAMMLGRMGSWEADFVNGIRIWTPEGMAVFGIDLTDGLGQIGGEKDEFLQALHPEDRHLLPQFHALARSQDSFPAEYRILKPNGQIRWLSGYGRVVDRDPEGNARHLINVVTDITERKAAEEHQRFLLQELSHRSKNLLSVVQSLAAQTLHSWKDPNEFQDRFMGRLRGLAASNTLLASGDWRGTSLRALIERQLAPFVGFPSARIEVQGPNVGLTAEATQAIGLVLHELATNAVKHGALSLPHGTLSIKWEIEAQSRGGLNLDWRERGGPSVKVPKRQGFGYVVMKKMAEQALNGKVEVDFAPEGLRWSLMAPSTVFVI